MNQISKPTGLAKYRELAPIVLICLVGVFLRVYRITTVPKGTLYDESFNALDALRIIAGARPIFFPADQGREALFQYLQAISIYLFGATDWPLRVPAVLVGCLTIPLSYLVLARLHNRRIALLTSAWFTVSLWHVMFSRIGLRAISVPFFGAAAFYFLWRGFDAAWTTDRTIEGTEAASRQWNGLGWFTLAGVTLGLSLYTYESARFIPTVVLVYAVYLLFFHRQRFQQALPGLILAGVLTVVIFVPEGIYFQRHPEEFLYRANNVSIFNPGLNHGDPTGTFLYTVTHSLGGFIWRGDGTWERNIPDRPVFDPLSSVLLIVGFVLLVRSARNPRSTFTLVWLVMMFVPSALSVLDVPNFLRVTGMIPTVFALPAIGVDWIWSLWDRYTPLKLKIVPPLIFAGVFVFGAYEVYDNYFRIWANDPMTIQTFSADHRLAISEARALVPQATTAIYVGAGDIDEPAMAYDLRGQGGSTGILVFNDHISMILPATGASSSYVFPQRDLPPAPLLNRFFPNQTGQILARGTDGETVSMFQMPVERPDLKPERPLVARFGNVLQVDGFDLARDVTAGQTLTVRWYWTLLAPEPRELKFFNQVLGSGDQKRGAFDDRAFAPDYWPAGTHGVSSFEVPVDAATTSGAYHLAVGVYYRDDMTRLPVFDTLGRQAGTQLELGPIKVHGRSAPPPALTNLQPHPASWADGVDFLGDDVPRAPVSPGQKTTMTFYWSARSRPSTDYTVFVHVLDGSNRVVAQGDAPPVSGNYPTSVWDHGDTIVDTHQLSLDPGIKPGEYTLDIGLYQPGNGQRLALVDGSGHSLGDHLLLPGFTVQ